MSSSSLGRSLTDILIRSFLSQLVILYQSDPTDYYSRNGTCNSVTTVKTCLVLDRDVPAGATRYLRIHPLVAYKRRGAVLDVERDVSR